MLEWKKLGEICVSLKKEIIKQDNLVTNGKYPVVNSGVTLYGRYNEYNNNGNAFTFASRGEYAGFLTYMSEDFWAGGLCYPYRSQDEEKYLTKFIYEYLKSQELYVMDRLVARGGIPALNKADVEKIQIPVPSIAEQTRIVGILDTFTASIENLKQQIAQRRKQYEHYRNQLLDLEGKEGVEMKTLGEICEIKGRIGFRGYTREDQVAQGEGALSLSPGNIINGKMDYSDSTYISWKKYEESPEIMVFEGDVLFCKTGSTVGKVAIANDIPYKATINPQLVVLKDVKIGSKYLYFYLTTPYIQKVVKALAGVGSVPNISQAKLSELKILLPSLSEQSRIVSILDTFEAIIANLEQQLAQREKQYEYYRNKLLTFE